MVDGVGLSCTAFDTEWNDVSALTSREPHHFYMVEGARSWP